MIDGSADSPAGAPEESSVSQLPQEIDQGTLVEESIVNDGQSPSNQEGSQSVADAQQVPPSEQSNLEEDQSSSQNPEQTGSSDSMMYPSEGTETSQQGSTPGEMMYPTEGVGASQQEQGSTPGQNMYPTEGSDIQQNQGSTSGPMMYPPAGSDNQPEQDSTSGQMMYPPEGAENIPSMEISSQTQSQQNEGSPVESSSSPSIPEQSASTPEQVSSGLEESSQQPIQPVETEAPSTPDAQPISNDEPEGSSASAAVESSSPPGAQETSPGKLPPKTQDSNIIKIYPEPVSGVNGKFTLPGGIYIVSTSTDIPNNNQLKPVHPSAGEQVVGGGETIVGSKPIIIVTSPAGSISPPVDEMPALPNFPSDFPPMGSQESQVPPVDDSSLELLQRPRPPVPVTDSVPSSSPSMSYPSSTSTELPQTTVISSDSAIVNDEQQQPVAETTTGNYMQYPSGQSEVQTTTNIPQQDESVGAETTQRIVSPGSQQQDESEIPTTVRPAQQQPADQQIASGDSSSSNSVITPTTNEPPLLDDDDEGNDAFTIIPINENPSEKTSGSTTTETFDVAAGVSEVAATTVKSQPVDAADQEAQAEGATTISSVSVDGVQESDSIITQSPAIISGSQDTGIETTTIFEKKQQQITTLLPGSDESDESSEEITATRAPGGEEEADIQKTTVLPEVSNDFIAPTTISSVQVDINHDDSAPSGQDEESLPATTTSSNVQQPNAEITTIASAAPAQHEQDIVSQGGIMYPPGSESMVSEMRYPTSLAPDIVLNPGSEVVENSDQNERIPGDSGAIPSNQQHDDANQNQVSETLQPFPATSPATTGEAGFEQQQLFPGSETSADQPELEPESTRSPTTISDQQQSFPASESSTSESESTTITVSTGSSDPQQQSDAGSESGTTSESSSATNDGDTTGVPTTSSPAIIGIQQDGISGSESSIDGGSTIVPGNEQPSSDGTDTSNEPSTVSSTGSEPIDTTSRPAGVSGSESLPTGGESSSQGSEPIASGTESPISGNDSSVPGASDQADEPISPGSESLVSESAAAATSEPSSASSQSTDSSNQTSESSTPNADEPISTPESIPTEQPSSIPSNDEPAQSADDSDDADNQSFISSTSIPSTGRPVETESISQDYVPSVPSATTEDASPVPESTPEADSPVPADSMQDSQPVVSTSEVPQDVSSPASVTNSPDMTAMYSPSTAAPVDVTLAPENIMPNYQILKACKFQNFFRSVNDMAYSYRHYPWLVSKTGVTN